MKQNTTEDRGNPLSGRQMFGNADWKYDVQKSRMTRCRSCQTIRLIVIIGSFLILIHNYRRNYARRTTRELKTKDF